ncbi:MAG TPA: lysozyme inhibitor LprI family protein [Allosphingosinicella sp.]|nr:lysozyme inhibitor LprI family protein [Allosphingosinicella sp.]
MRGYTLGLIVSVIVVPAVLIAALLLGAQPKPPPIVRVDKAPVPIIRKPVSVEALFPRWDWGHADWGWDEADNVQSKALCLSVADREPPDSDRPTAKERKALGSCRSEIFYYGLGAKPDPVRARKCAFIEADKEWEYGHQGRKMLMVIYANGRGAKRNLDVAMHLACGLRFSSMAEFQGRLAHLNQLKLSGSVGQDFDYCDDITSGQSGGECAHHDAELAWPVRQAELARLTSGWSAGEKRNYAALWKAFEAFADAHSAHELDWSGTLAEAMAVREQERLRDGFLSRMKQLSAGRMPSYTAAEFKVADRKLNAAYVALLGSEERMDWVGADTKLVRKTERLWLRYRDAFEALVRIRYPQMRPESIRGWLTEERTEMLDEAPAPYEPGGFDQA